MTKFLLALATLALFGACSKSPQAPKEPNKQLDKIISNRPQNRTQFIAILKLKTPALLEKAKRQDGVLVLNEDHKKSLNEEQEKTIAELKKLSSEVKVLNRYRLVLNAVAILAPKSIEKDLRKVFAVSYVEHEGQFARPETFAENNTTAESGDLNENNSTSFIGAHRVHQELTYTNAQGETLPVDGKGMKIGVIDSGIDFTHAMFGGEGTEEAYKAVNPDKATHAFPNEKVVGGIDLVGTDYHAGSGDFKRHIPKPDLNPLDEGGHGTHVAGTVAGIGDGENTYSGVAPKADLYAIKVFGKRGSTGDTVILAAFEYSIDPNGDLDLSDQLDVINLSLGSPYGSPHSLYKEAVKNVSEAGTVVVASAGNSGDEPFITGSPGSVDESLSVAASVDNMEHNWRFRAVLFSSDSNQHRATEAIEGSISKPIKDAGDVSGPLVHVGLADADIAPDVAARLKGNIALIDRGKVTFASKLQRVVKAGAIGAVVVNNKPGDPITMGGDGKVEIPAIMITQALGNILKADFKKGEVRIQFQTDERVEKPELIDTLAGFTSRGPRSEDAKLKPEISAPGYNVISAAMGKGDKGVKFSGTSMAAPHMAGVMALLKQKHAKLTPAELKSLVMNNTKTIANKDKKTYPVSLQGSGRVQTFKAATGKLLTTPASLSLGQVLVEGKKMLRKVVSVKNISTEPLQLELEAKQTEHLKVFFANTALKLKAGASKTVEILFEISAPKKTTTEELEGLVLIKQDGEELGRVAYLALANRLSRIEAQNLAVYAGSHDDADGAYSTLQLTNQSKNAGEALLFNLLGVDKRKKKSGVQNSTRSLFCDLEAAGFRVVKREDKSFLQIGVKLYNPVTTWQPCEISAQIDVDGDGVAEQELAGIIHDHLGGLDGNAYNSILLDAAKVREIRKAWEVTQASSDPDVRSKRVDYKKAIEDVQTMFTYNQSTVTVIEADLEKLRLTDSGELKIKLGVLNVDGGAIEADDFLGEGLEQWMALNPTGNNPAFIDLPEKVDVPAGVSRTVPLKKGATQADLLILYPFNKFTKSHTLRDKQAQILSPKFLFN